MEELINIIYFLLKEYKTKEQIQKKAFILTDLVMQTALKVAGELEDQPELELKDVIKMLEKEKPITKVKEEITDKETDGYNNEQLRMI